jgi:dTDP-4-amino-4,6-dideoxygalactose transaminase
MKWFFLTLQQSYKIELNKMVKFSEWPIFDQEEIDAVTNVVKSGKWWCGAPNSHAGENIWKLQEEFAKFNESKFAWPCTNGTHAIEIVLLAMGIGIGDEVIVSDWTFVASGSVVVSVGAVPVFCDVDPESFVIDVKKMESLITPRTKAIICVHLGGMPCEMDKIMEIAKKRNLKVIEDCAHAHGSRYKGKRVGNWGDAGTFSFQASKVMTAGEGGMIVCNDTDLSARIYEVLDSGRHPGEWFYDHFVYGSNYRLSEFNAAILRTQLKKYLPQLAKRNEAAKYLNAELIKIPGVHPQKRGLGVEESGNYVYPVYFEPDKFGGITYKEMYKELEAAKIPTDACYPPLHRLDCFKDVKLKKGIDYSNGNFGGSKSDDKNFPVVTKLHTNSFELGQEVLLSDKEALNFVVETVKNIQKKYQK